MDPFFPFPHTLPQMVFFATEALTTGTILQHPTYANIWLHKVKVPLLTATVSEPFFHIWAGLESSDGVHLWSGHWSS